MPTSCETYIVPTFQEDLCNGKTKPATCIIDKNLYAELGIEENSNQQQINQAIYLAFLNLKATVENLQSQIEVL